MNSVTISSIEMQLEGSTRSLSTGKVYNNKIKQNKYDYNHLDEKAAYKKHAAAKIARKQGKKIMIHSEYLFSLTLYANKPRRHTLTTVSAMKFA
jgi:hypothetical protein